MEEIKVDQPPLSQENVVKPLVVPWALPKISLDRKTLLILLIPVVVGIVSGFLLYKLNTAGTIKLGGKNFEMVQTPTEEGVKDAATFRDTATGNITENDGKITNEGTHILTRGDASQNVYLTSSVIDLSKYVGKKVQIWGETFKGQKAGWLMDIGRIKVVN